MAAIEVTIDEQDARAVAELLDRRALRIEYENRDPWTDNEIVTRDRCLRVQRAIETALLAR